MDSLSQPSWGAALLRSSVATLLLAPLGLALGGDSLGGDSLGSDSPSGGRLDPPLHLASDSGHSLGLDELHAAADPGQDLRLAWVPNRGLLVAGGTPGGRLHLMLDLPEGPVWIGTTVAGPDGCGVYGSNTYEPGGGETFRVMSGSGLGGRLTVDASSVPGSSGEVVFTEFLADPTAVSDAFGEWVEVFNTTNHAIDLEGWVLADEGTDATVLDNAGAGIVIAPRSSLVLGREASPAFNGGLVPAATYQGFTLSNQADELLLRRPGGRLVDRVAYETGSWPVTAGASAALSQARLDAGWNDDPRWWCTGSGVLPGGDLGTPGSFNGPCP